MEKERLLESTIIWAEIGDSINSYLEVKESIKDLKKDVRIKILKILIKYLMTQCEYLNDYFDKELESITWVN